METEKTMIMVIDDELQLCNIMRRILELEGYKVAVSCSGLEAVPFIKQKKVDVVLLDIMMPGLSGREVCQQIRKCSPETKVIYFTASVYHEDHRKVRELCKEADAVIVKPASVKQIVSKLSYVLNG
ncbi:MAG: response regulator [Chloroflexi bacterium]|nr:response regulator [Chloroflexota bacterium]